VDRHSVSERHHSKVTSIQLENSPPEAVPIPFLLLDSNRGFDDSDAPVPLQVRTPAEYLLLEVLRKAIRRSLGRHPTRSWPMRPGVSSVQRAVYHGAALTRVQTLRAVDVRQRGLVERGEISPTHRRTSQLAQNPVEYYNRQLRRSRNLDSERLPIRREINDQPRIDLAGSHVLPASEARQIVVRGQCAPMTRRDFEVRRFHDSTG
jgi:hypothetical protein